MKTEEKIYAIATALLPTLLSNATGGREILDPNAWLVGTPDGKFSPEKQQEIESAWKKAVDIANVCIHSGTKTAP